MNIAIIGAGFTGLSAAYGLSKKGYKVTVFEKDANPGGLAIGYKQKDQEFELGPYDGQDYPQVNMEKAAFSPLTIVQYHWVTIQDVFYQTSIYIKDLSTSIRFFELNALIASFILAFLTLLSLSSRLHIPLRALPNYFAHLSKIHALQKQMAQRVKGRVFDEQSGQTLKGADIYLIDLDKDKIVTHTKTDTNGNFEFTKLTNGTYEIEVMKDGFEPVTFRESEIQTDCVGTGKVCSAREP